MVSERPSGTVHVDLLLKQNEILTPMFLPPFTKEALKIKTGTIIGVRGYVKLGPDGYDIVAQSFTYIKEADHGTSDS